MPFPTIDPVFLRIGPLSFHWYGLMYVVGLFLGFQLTRPILEARHRLNMDQILNIFSAVIAGILIGGRLGYVFFYHAPYFLNAPLEIFAIWQGGMSYHGGAIGCLIAVLIMSRHYRVSHWGLLDLLGIGSTFGIALGRIGNFINGELWGRVTTVPWGIVFPGAGPLPRHPSQLYESVLEGWLLLLILTLLMRRGRLPEGGLFAVYLLGYGAMRFALEFFREPDSHLGLVLGPFSMGQCLSGLMIAMGIGVFWYVTRASDRK